MKEIHTFRTPDNWHIHPRNGKLLGLIYHNFNIYGRALCMGNLKKLIETTDEAFDYRQEIIDKGALFEPVMCIMLTQDTTPEMVREADRRGIKFVKFIPVGTSHGASKGLRIDGFESLFRIFEVIAECGMFLLVHAELMYDSDGRKIHFIDREEEAIGCIYVYLDNFPNLKITIEHASTATMINFIRLQPLNINIGATLAPQHGILTYDMVFGDKSWPPENVDNFCLPVAKTELDRQAVVAAMISGDSRFYAGTDAAAHWASDKDSDKIPPGVFFGRYEYLRSLETFDNAGALKKFDDFWSRFGAERYGFPLNKGKIRVAREEWKQPVGEDGIR